MDRVSSDVFSGPPAIVRQADSLVEIMGRINDMHRAGQANTATGVEQFREAGLNLLKAKSLVPHGEWTDWLKKNIKCSLRECQRYMRLAAKFPKSVIVSHLDEAMKLLAEKDEDEAPQQQPAPQLASSIFCPRCQRVGPVANCPACQAVRSSHSQKTGSSSSHERQPGDDTELERAEREKDREARKRQGEEKFSLKRLQEFLGRAMAEIDKLAREQHGFKHKQTPEQRAVAVHFDAIASEIKTWCETFRKTSA